MAKVVLKDIKKVYEKSIVAVQDVSFEIADKEFVVLVGPSGCGKSTTLRMVAGLEEITEGELYIGDTLVNEIAPKDRDIAMVFQNYALYPHMTVFDNMGFALKQRHFSKAEIQKRVHEAAEILNITELLHRKPKALSGGQRQRVAIGRAIVREPQVFLMDEPLSNLDAKLRNQMRAEIIKLHKRLDTTFIYVTHDQTEAMTLGDRIVIMKDGFIQQIGTPQEVFNHPSNLFVAGFIGTPQMNFFDAKLIKQEKKYFVDLYGLKIGLTEKMNSLLSEKNTNKQKIKLGIRPEHLSLARQGEEGALTADIDVSEMMGSEMHMHLSVEGKDVVIRVPTIEMEKYFDETGNRSSISFLFPSALIHLFKSAEEDIDEYNLVYGEPDGESDV
jgi:multiple sugar transport system ATP-binding protein